jgi:hypothetical protein
MNDVELARGQAEYVMAFAEFSRRLIEIGVALDGLNLGGFGSFTLVMRKGTEAVRFRFDGRDRYIETEISPIRQWSAPNQWEKVEAKAIAGTYSEALSYAETFLRKRLENIPISNLQ